MYCETTNPPPLWGRVFFALGPPREQLYMRLTSSFMYTHGLRHAWSFERLPMVSHTNLYGRGCRHARPGAI